ncbi:MAG TPA: ScpA family protein [Dehalococcoidia bacterium]|nr:ScpA family protein [Dehalococcoidia bacterium]
MMPKRAAAPSARTLDSERGAAASRTLRLDNFEGGLDLLLHLIEKQNLDITAISLARVTDQYLQILHSDTSVDAGALADFIAIGSKLLLIKSRALLPQPELSAGGDQEDETAVDLTEALLEYRKFKEAAKLLRSREDSNLRAYPRAVPPPGVELPPGLDDVTGETLLRLFQEALSREEQVRPTPLRPIERDTITLRDKVAQLRTAIRRSRMLSFRRLVAGCQSRVEIVVQFMAVLELIKSGEVEARQAALFADIELVAAGHSSGQTSTPADAADREAIA